METPTAPWPTRPDDDRDVRLYKWWSVDSGERTRLVCGRRRPRLRELFRNVSATARKRGREGACAPQKTMSEDLLALFRKTGALLDGHFVLRSGLHSRQYFQCAILLSHTDIAERVCEMLADKLRKVDCDSVISPALGGIIVGQEVGRSLGKRHIFVEKEEGKLVLRRGFNINRGEKFIVVRRRGYAWRKGSRDGRHCPREWRNRLRRRRDC